MTRSLLVLSLLAGGSAFADDTTAATPFTPTAEQEAVYRALSVRHESLSCDQLDAMSEQPLQTYLVLIEHARQPAWVGMRAARCVLQNHSEAARPELERWVTSDQTRGLAILTMQQLDLLPLELAQELATRALTEGPDPEGMRRRIAKSEVPEIAALAELPVVQPAGE